jgi:anti-sigma B factor antagonist
LTLDKGAGGAPFDARVERHAAAVVVRVSGELDVACKDTFETAIHDAVRDGPAELVIDLRKLSFIDSFGLAMLLALWQQCAKDGHDLAIVQGTGQVRRAIEVAGLDGVLPIVDTGTALDRDSAH